MERDGKLPRLVAAGRSIKAPKVVYLRMSDVTSGDYFYAQKIYAYQKYSIKNRVLLVAGAGLEPATSRLWAWRAAIALPRVVVG